MKEGKRLLKGRRDEGYECPNLYIVRSSSVRVTIDKIIVPTVRFTEYEEVAFLFGGADERTWKFLLMKSDLDAHTGFLEVTVKITLNCR